jgi:hypothetical protein
VIAPIEGNKEKANQHQASTSICYDRFHPLILILQALLHIVPFCEGPNEKPEGFAKQKQSAIFAMQHASQLVVHHPSLIYNVPLIIATLLRHIQQKKLCDPLSLCPP